MARRQMSEEHRIFVKKEIEAMDRMLLNAYGTAYKIAVKYLIYKKIGFQLSEYEELLMAKNLVTNLWSVLDYCCFLIYTNAKGRPDTKTALKIGTPCHYKYRIKRVTSIFRTIDNMFWDLQYYNTRYLRDDVLTFYWLHFLRNTFTHKTIDISVNTKKLMPNVLKGFKLDHPEVAVNVVVPRLPWNKVVGDISIPLLDLLFNACKLVKERRDKIIREQLKLDWPFPFHFSLDAEPMGLAVKVTFGHKTTSIHYKNLHLKCYGLEQEYQKEIARAYPE